MSKFRLHDDVHISAGRGGHDFSAGEHEAADLAEERALHLAVKTGHAELVGPNVPPGVREASEVGGREPEVDETSSDVGNIVSPWQTGDSALIEEEG